MSEATELTVVAVDVFQSGTRANPGPHKCGTEFELYDGTAKVADHIRDRRLAHLFAVAPLQTRRIAALEAERDRLRSALVGFMHADPDVFRSELANARAALAPAPEGGKP